MTASSSDADGRTTDLDAIVRGAIAHLSPAERRVAHLLEHDAGRIARLTATELAHEAATSAATVVRTAKHLGFQGYPQLRYALAAKAGAETAGGAEKPRVADITDDDAFPAILAKLAAFECGQITATARLVAIDLLEDTAVRIAQAGRVCIFGVGASGLVAQDLAQKLTRIGLVAFVHVEHDGGVVAASLLGPRDVALGISDGGETPGSHEPVRQARDRGAFTAAITGDPRSTLARHADVVLATAGREAGPRPAAVGSRISQLLIVDALFVRLTQLIPTTAGALDRTFAAVAAGRTRGGR